MLRADRPWWGQLIGLNVINRSTVLPFLEALLDAINFLPALQYLTLKDVSLLNYPLPILAQLKEITIEGYTVCDWYLSTFIHSFQQYASSNAEGLRVGLFTPFDKAATCQLQQQLSEPLRRCFTCLSRKSMLVFDSQELLNLRLTTFPNLTSLILSLSAKSIRTAFSVFAQLPQLVRLSLNVIWTDVPPETPPLLPPPCDQLRSVKSLQLILALTSHLQLHWLNLSVTVPNVLEISLDIWCCNLCDYHSMFSPPDRSPSSRSCLRTHLQQLMDITGTPSHRIACFHNDQQVSAEELLAEEQQ